MKSSAQTPPGQKPDQSTRQFGAATLMKHLSALEVEVSGVRESQDIECIHRMRVASRRLRAALPLFKDCFPAKRVSSWLLQIRAITRALGAARDADVKLEAIEQMEQTLPDPRFRAGLVRLALRLRQQRLLHQNDVSMALDAFESSAVLKDMHSHLSDLHPEDAAPPYTHKLYLRADRALVAHVHEFLQHQDAVHRPEAVAELHAMRITAKALRYVLETFAPLYPDELRPYLQVMRKAQDTLGVIHDCDVWGIFLPEFADQERQRVLDFYGTDRPFARVIPGLNYFIAERKAERERQYLEFIADWDRWQGEQIWAQLEAQVNMPVLRRDRVYPPLASSTAKRPKDHAI